MAPRLTEIRDKALRNAVELLELSGLLPDVSIGQEENQNWIFSSHIDPRETAVYRNINYSLYAC